MQYYILIKYVINKSKGGERKLAETLNELVKMYLEKNGMRVRFFAEYIDEEYTATQKWLKGQYNFRPDVIKRIHRFLTESHKSIENIYTEE